MLSTDIAKDIQKAVDRRFDEQVDFTAELVGFPSTRAMKPRPRTSWPRPLRSGAWSWTGGN